MLNQMYLDFTTKLLPKIQEGLSISKEYFLDLFGRYVHYLILMDTIYLIANLTILIALLFCIKPVYKWVKSDDHDDPERWVGFICLLGAIGLFACVTFVHAQNLIKDHYLPEIRVWEELKDFQK